MTNPKKHLKKRLSREKRFRFVTFLSLAIPITFLTFLVGHIFYQAWPAFFHHYIDLEMNAEDLPSSSFKESNPDYRLLTRQLLEKNLEITATSQQRRELPRMLSPHASDDLAITLQKLPSAPAMPYIVSLPMSAVIDQYLTTGDNSKLTANQQQWVAALETQEKINRAFDTSFWQSGDSREPEEAGIWGSVMGSFLTMIITLLLSLPFGAAAALYLEEFAKKNFLSRLIEININNLAAVPSIIFGLLGIVLFLGIFGLPRSSPLVGGMVLALMTLPVIIIAARASLRAIPTSIRQAALAVGASHSQVIWHHVFPLALPGILTGTILGMARALGETAPLMMIGMIAFIVDIPSGFTDPSTVLPAQIFMWSDLQETAFVEKTYAAILVLIIFLIMMNLLAIIIRQRVEKKW